MTKERKLQLRGLDLLPQVMDAGGPLGQLKEDPDTLKLSRAGAERNILALAQNHLDLDEEEVSKGEWKKVRNRLEDIIHAVDALQSALKSAFQSPPPPSPTAPPRPARFETFTIIAHIIQRSGSQLTSINHSKQLDQLLRDVSGLLEFVPENNMGDAVATVIRSGTANEMLVLGCQNILCACGRKAGAGPKGNLERLAKLVKRLALGADDKAGGIHKAAESPKVKGRFDRANLREEALGLIIGDLKSRGKTESELFRQAQAELAKLAEVISTRAKNR